MFINQNKINPNELVSIIMKTFYYSTRINISMYDLSSQTLFSYPRLIPHPIDQFNLETILKRIITPNFNFKTNYLIKINKFEKFIIHPYKRQGHNGVFATGPFVNHEITNSHIDVLIDTYQLSIKDKIKLDKYYKKIPIVQPIQNQFIKILLGSLTRTQAEDLPMFYDEIEDEKLDQINYEKLYSKLFLNWSFQVSHHRFADEERFFSGLFNSANEKEVIRLLDSFSAEDEDFEILPTLCTYDEIRSLKNLLISTVTLTSRYAIKKGLDSEIALNYSDIFIQKIELCDSKKELIKLRKELFLTYYELVSQLDSLNYSPIVNHTIKIINSKLKSSITLNEISEILNCNSSYLSNIFKKETGKNIKLYINEKKIALAKNIIINSNKTVNEIADYLGFKSLTHFSITFKKITGQSPSEFRKTNQ